MIRQCHLCGAQIFVCNGFVHAGDLLAAQDGRLPYWKVREKCWRCVEWEMPEMIKGKPCEICGGEFRYDDGRCVKCKRQRNKLQREIARAVEDEIFPDIVSGRDDIKLTEKENFQFLMALWHERRRSQHVTRKTVPQHIHKNKTSIRTDTDGA